MDCNGQCHEGEVNLYMSKTGGGKKKDGTAESDPKACNRGKKVRMPPNFGGKTRTGAMIEQTNFGERDLTSHQRHSVVSRTVGKILQTSVIGLDGKS
jgi:hypothetical protein